MAHTPPHSDPARGKKVLIVDDDPDMRMMVSMLLSSHGYSVVGESQDGADAVPDSFEEQPDFVILDYMMPNIDGEQAAGFIRATCPSAYIVAFSGAGLKSPKWADDFLDKNDITKLPHLLDHVAAEREALLTS